MAGLARRPQVLTCRGPVDNKCDVEQSPITGSKSGSGSDAFLSGSRLPPPRPLILSYDRAVPRWRDAWNATAG